MKEEVEAPTPEIEEHEHQYGVYYDDNLEPHEFCVICSPRTEEEKKKDEENILKLLKKQKARLTAERVTSLDDGAAILLSGIKEKNEKWYMQVAAYTYKGLTFQWTDVAKKAWLGTESSNRVREMSLQYAIASMLESEQSDIDQVRQLEASLDNVEDTTDFFQKMVDIAGQGGGLTGVPALGAVGNGISVVNGLISTGFDLAHYKNWSDQQKELFCKSMADAEQKMLLLEHLKETYPEDEMLQTYCDEAIDDIWLWSKSELVGSVDRAMTDGWKGFTIVLGNTVDTGVNIGIGVATEAVAGVGGLFVAFSGAVTGFATEWIAGSNSTADASEDIDRVYTTIEKSAAAYNRVKDDQGILDPVKRFQEYNILYLKLGGLEMAKKINKGQLENEISVIEASYEQYIKDLAQ